MHCTDCGATLAGKGRFCAHCGTQIDETQRDVDAKDTRRSASENHNLSGPQVLGGLAVGVIAVVLLGWLQYGGSDDTGNGSIAENSSQAAVLSIRERLEDAARDQIFSSKYSVGKRDGGLCDSVERARLSNVTVGTISTTAFTGDLANPLPAIVAKHEFVCVNRAMAKRTPEKDQWVVLAIDDEFDMIRCTRTGFKSTIDQIAQECGFQPTPVGSEQSGRDARSPVSAVTVEQVKSMSEDELSELSADSLLAFYTIDGNGDKLTRQETLKLGSALSRAQKRKLNELQDALSRFP